MHPFNRPAGPIGSNAVAPMQATSSGMLVTANKLGAPPEVLDFKGYFKVESFPHNAVIYRPGDMSDRVYLLKSGRVRLMRVGKSGARSVTLALDVIRAFADRVRALHKRVLGLTFKEVPARLADTLLTLSEAHGERCLHGGETDLRGITQQDLADLVGASRSFVSTLINEMKRDGVLGNVGRTLCVRDQKALRRAASEEK